MPQPFKMYRIVCAITDKALVSGSDYPRWGTQWHERGHWSDVSGAFWKGEHTVKRHLRNLCHDWRSRVTFEPTRVWHEIITEHPDWTRLEHLRVEKFLVTDYSVTKLPAADFMGIPDQRAA